MVTWLNDHASILALALLIVTAIYAWVTWKIATETGKQAKTQALVIVLGQLATSEESEARRYVLTQKIPPPTEMICDAGNGCSFISSRDQAAYARCHTVIASFDRVGALVKLKYIPKEPVLEIYDDLVIKCWQILEPYVRRERKIRLQPAYQCHFQWLYKQSCEWRKAKARHARERDTRQEEHKA